MIQSREKLIFTRLKRIAKKTALSKKDVVSIPAYFEELKTIRSEDVTLQYDILKSLSDLLMMGAKFNKSYMIALILKEFEEVKEIKLNYGNYNTESNDFFAEWLSDEVKFSTLKSQQASWSSTFSLLHAHFSNKLDGDKELQNQVLEQMMIFLPSLTGGEKRMLKSGYYKQQVELIELFVQNYDCVLNDENNFFSKMKTQEIWNVFETYNIPILLSKEKLLRSSTALFDDTMVQEENLSGTIYLNGADIVVKLKPILAQLDWEVDDFLLSVAFSESQKMASEKSLFSAQQYVYQYFHSRNINLEDLSYKDHQGHLNHVRNDLKTMPIEPILKMKLDLDKTIKKVPQKTDLVFPTPIQRF